MENTPARPPSPAFPLDIQTHEGSFFAFLWSLLNWNMQIKKWNYTFLTDSKLPVSLKDASNTKKINDNHVAHSFTLEGFCFVFSTANHNILSQFLETVTVKLSCLPTEILAQLWLILRLFQCLFKLVNQNWTEVNFWNLLTIIILLDFYQVLQQNYKLSGIFLDLHLKCFPY